MVLGWRRRSIREVDVEIIPPELAEPWPNDMVNAARRDLPDTGEMDNSGRVATSLQGQNHVRASIVVDDAEAAGKPEESKEAGFGQPQPPGPEPARVEAPTQIEDVEEANVPATVEASPPHEERAKIEETYKAEPQPPHKEPEHAEPSVAADGQPEVRDATCEIALWRGWRQASFYARMVVDDRELAIAQSETFRPTGKRELEESEPAVAAHRALCEELVRRGWTRTGRNDAWYADGFRAVVQLPEETDDDETGSF